jgi:hypothetical protein
MLEALLCRTVLAAVPRQSSSREASELGLDALMRWSVACTFGTVPNVLGAGLVTAEQGASNVSISRMFTGHPALQLADSEPA